MRLCEHTSSANAACVWNILMYFGRFSASSVIINNESSQAEEIVQRNFNCAKLWLSRIDESRIDCYTCYHNRKVASISPPLSTQELAHRQILIVRQTVRFAAIKFSWLPVYKLYRQLRNSPTIFGEFRQSPTPLAVGLLPKNIQHVCTLTRQRWSVETVNNRAPLIIIPKRRSCLGKKILVTTTTSHRLLRDAIN